MATNNEMWASLSCFESSHLSPWIPYELEAVNLWPDVCKKATISIYSVRLGGQINVLVDGQVTEGRDVTERSEGWTSSMIQLRMDGPMCQHVQMSEIIHVFYMYM